MLVGIRELSLLEDRYVGSWDWGREATGSPNCIAIILIFPPFGVYMFYFFTHTNDASIKSCEKQMWVMIDNALVKSRQYSLLHETL